MFVSTGNNFGAGDIRFKSYQAENYVVLNARFSFLTNATAYQSADVLEIYVPSLRIDRSAEVAVVVGFRDRRQYFGNATAYDACTIARSWIKDSHTICIEKLDCFEGKECLYVYIQALYPQLNQGTNATKQTQSPVSVTPSFSDFSLLSDSFSLIYEHWVFLYIKLATYAAGDQYKSWIGALENVPEDVVEIVPEVCSEMQYNYEFSGLSEIILQRGRFVSNYRCNSGHNGFIFAFLVRGDNDGEIIDERPMAEGDQRLRIECFRESGSAYLRKGHYFLELGEGLLFSSVNGFFESNGAGNGNELELLNRCSIFPAGKTGFVARSKEGAGLAIYSCYLETTMEQTYSRISLACIAEAGNEVDIFDTGIYAYPG